MGKKYYNFFVIKDGKRIYHSEAFESKLDAKKALWRYRMPHPHLTKSDMRKRNLKSTLQEEQNYALALGESEKTKKRFVNDIFASLKDWEEAPREQWEEEGGEYYEFGSGKNVQRWANRESALKALLRYRMPNPHLTKSEMRKRNIKSTLQEERNYTIAFGEFETTKKKFVNEIFASLKDWEEAPREQWEKEGGEYYEFGQGKYVQRWADRDNAIDAESTYILERYPPSGDFSFEVK